MKFLKKSLLPLALALCMIAACLVAAGCAGNTPADESSTPEKTVSTASTDESTTGGESTASGENSSEAGAESDADSTASADESTGDSSEASKESSKEESKETSKEESKETSKEESKETSKEESKETSKEESKETSKEESKDTSKEESKETSKEESGETSETSGEEPNPIADAVIGKWKAEIDIVPLIKLLAQQTPGTETSENPQYEQFAVIINGLLSTMKGINLPLYVTLGEDGSFVSDVDEKELKETLSKAYETYFKKTFALIIKMMGGDLDAYLEKQGISIDELVETMLQNMDLSKLHMEGTYRVIGNRVYLDNSEQYAVIEVKSEKKIAITEIVGVQDDMNLMSALLPIEFDRVK